MTQYIRYDDKINISEIMILIDRSHPLLKIIFKKQIIYGAIYVDKFYHGFYLL